MDESNIKIVETAEERLRRAMLTSSLSELDALLADDLIFVNHLGQVMTKQDDLRAHQSGYVDIDHIENSEQVIRLEGEVAVVTQWTRIDGKFGGVESESELRFMRIWKKRGNGQYCLIAAQSTEVE